MLLHSNILGQGKPLVILHGFLGMGDNWKTLGKEFSEQGYQVHLIDQVFMTKHLVMRLW